MLRQPHVVPEAQVLEPSHAPPFGTITIGEVDGVTEGVGETDGVGDGVVDGVGVTDDVGLGDGLNATQFTPVASVQPTVAPTTSGSVFNGR